MQMPKAGRSVAVGLSGLPVRLGPDRRALETVDFLLSPASGSPELLPLVHQSVRPPANGWVLQVSYRHEYICRTVNPPEPTYGQNRRRSCPMTGYLALNLVSDFRRGRGIPPTSLVLNSLEGELKAVQVLDDLGLGRLSGLVLLLYSQHRIGSSDWSAHIPQSPESLPRVPVTLPAEHLV